MVVRLIYEAGIDQRVGVVHPHAAGSRYHGTALQSLTEAEGLDAALDALV
jgi:hypothetical protein